MAFAMALEQLGSEHVQTQVIDCREPGSAWPKGFTISNFMKNVRFSYFLKHPNAYMNSRQLYSLQVKFQGLTNQVEFDNEGVRRNIAVDVAELKPGGLETVGKWLWERTMESKSRFEVTRKSSVLSANKTLVVIMALVG